MSAEEGESRNRFAARAKEPEDPVLKSLRIKVSTLKRNLKDFEFAQKEVVRETARLESVKESNPDRVRQQETVLSEAQMMIPHSVNRIRAAIKDLKEFLDSGDLNNKDGEAVQTARQALEEGELALSKS